MCVGVRVNDLGVLLLKVQLTDLNHIVCLVTKKVFVFKERKRKKRAISKFLTQIFGRF